jgi:hypothetical protein
MLNFISPSLCREEIAELFDFVDLDDSKIIEFKEFLVALTVGEQYSSFPSPPFDLFLLPTGHVLNILPDHGSSRQASLPEVQGMQCKAEDIDMVLNLIVSAYLLFDPHGVGEINKNSVTNMISEAKGTERKNAMLSQQRWNEMVSSLASPLPFPPHLIPQGLGCQRKHRLPRVRAGLLYLGRHRGDRLTGTTLPLDCGVVAVGVRVSIERERNNKDLRLERVGRVDGRPPAL